MTIVPVMLTLLWTVELNEFVDFSLNGEENSCRIDIASKSEETVENEGSVRKLGGFRQDLVGF